LNLGNLRHELRHTKHKPSKNRLEYLLINEPLAVFYSLSALGEK